MRRVVRKQEVRNVSGLGVLRLACFAIMRHSK